MKPIFKIPVLVACLVWLTGCIEQYDLKVDDQEKILVVNGLITDEPGPYTVKLSTTFKYGAFFSDIDPSVEGATVSISDETGATETLKEKSTGVYVTDTNGMRGRIGGQYSLKIRLKNGKEYASATETLLAVPAIERLYARLKPVLQVDKDGNSLTKNYVQFLIDTKDPSGIRNFYRWSFINTYEISTQPWDFVVYGKNGPIPQPKDCCDQCWITKANTVANVANDHQFNGNSLIEHQVALLPFTAELFQNKHHIEVKQYALSETAYSFWKILNSQISETGSIQEPAPANAGGNIKNPANPNEEILGYFNAAGVSKRTLFVQPREFGINAGVLVFPDDCRVALGATTNRPSFW